MDPLLDDKEPKPQNVFPFFYELHMNISLSFCECLVQYSSHVCKATQRFVDFLNFRKVTTREKRARNVIFRHVMYIMDFF